MKKFILVVLALFSVVLSSCSSSKSEIVVTSFPGYDAARAVVGDDVSIKMLLKPGNDIHSYEPSGADVRAINESKLFIYVGGESDEWVESDILPNIGKDTKVVSMVDVLESKLLLEDGEEDEYDEHVWTDPSNYKMVVEEVYKTLKEIYPDKAEKFENNKTSYTAKLNLICSEIETAVNGAKNKFVVVADRNPLKYFFNRFNLSYASALNGCSQDKSVPQQKIVELKNKAEEYELKFIFIVELSDSNIANTVKKEIDNDIKSGLYKKTSPEIRLFYSMQNITNDDFKANKTYVMMMNENLNTLKELFS